MQGAQIREDRGGTRSRNLAQNADRACKLVSQECKLDGSSSSDLRKYALNSLFKYEMRNNKMAVEKLCSGENIVCI